MCWINKVNETFVASTDIRVFKIARLEKHLFDNNKVRPYFIDDSDIEYVENKTYRCDTNGFCFTSIYQNGRKYAVHKAMHSYSIENIRLLCSSDTPAIIKVGTYKTTSQSQDVIIYSQYYWANAIAIMLCTIPKGTIYAVNTAGEIVSDEIRVEKIITNPFTFNKDSSLSKRSLEKINKILDNWEK